MAGELGEAIPARLGKLVGRADERARLRQLVAAGTPLVTVTGLSGVGKTRLVREALGDLIDAWISASDIDDSASLRPAVEQRAEGLLTKAAPDRQLIVLDSIDNEVVGRELISTLDRFSGLQVVITSRTRMNVRGEVLLRLEPLRYPEVGSPLDVTEASKWEAIECFVQSAERVRAGFRLTPVNLPGVVELVQSTGGLPLAIDLVANWLRVSNIDELATRVRTSFEPFTEGPADLPTRHRDLQNSVQSGIDELQDDDREVLVALAHLGAVSHQGLRQGLGRPVTLASLGRLVDRNLVQPIESDTTGISLHPMVRRVAAEQSDGRPTQSRFLGWVHEELVQTIPRLVTHDSKIAFGELDNLAADIAAALDLLTVQPAAVASIIVQLCKFWHITYQRRLQVAWTTKALELVKDDDHLRTQLHLGAEHAYRFLYNLERARVHRAAALATARHTNDHESLARALSAEVAVGLVEKLDRGEAEYIEAVELCRRHNLIALLADTLSTEAERLLSVGKTEQALEVATSAVETALTIDHLAILVWCLLVQSWVHTVNGSIELAMQSQRRALAAAEHIDARSALDLAVYMYEADTLATAGRADEAIGRLRHVIVGLQLIEVPIGLREATKLLAELQADTGQFVEARQHFKRAMELSIAVDDRLGIWDTLVCLAISAPDVRPDLSLCDLIIRSVSISMPSVVEGLPSHRAIRLSALRGDVAARFGSDSPATDVVSLEELARLTMRQLTGPEQPAPSHGLSGRELEVLRHVAVGETDGEIAAHLHIGTRTVNTHVSAVLRKLGVERRRQAAAWARANLELATPH